MVQGKGRQSTPGKGGKAKLKEVGISGKMGWGGGGQGDINLGKYRNETFKH